MCARCTGIYLGFFIMIPLLWFYQIGMIISIILILPTLIDGLTQAYLNRESTNFLRFSTGILAGIGMSGFSERITYHTYKFIELLLS
ncbi:Predicted membrane protein [Chryseobacterium indoltheticum]|uniref:Predicted membrane protein n=1 Tax=Chryseobacterium indoltheticum TaxID=254 RepID=A0A381FI38_9FLAO|nr:Predicted membrane protein [Chryseobacterium indoltheticum]SUX43239.1 Predicted membrane protein [Chryseobacterium indoltheticum]SUX46191.1 Predicted membrane protein [Chryseobacterium indoltheticum]